MTTLMSFGEALIDMLPGDSGSGYLPIPGGAPANVAVAFAKLGGQAVFCGGQGDDHLGRQLAQELQAYGVDTSAFYLLPGCQTALVLVSLDERGERSFSFYRQHTADLSLTQEHVDRTDLSHTDIFHFCSNTLTDSHITDMTLALLAKARSQGVMTSFDVNLRLSLWQHLEQLPERVESCYGHTDVLKLSTEELDYLAQAKGVTGKHYVELCLDAGITLVLVTDGPHPVRAYGRDVEESMPTPPIKVVDTTAAGDSFIAGFLWALSHQPLPLKQALQHPEAVRQALSTAVRCGALVCQAKGAFPSLPTASQFQAFHGN